MTTNYLSPIFLSLQITLIASIFIIFLGITIGYFMGKHKFYGKTILEIIFLLPIVLPPAVIGFILLMLLGNTSIFYPVINFIFNGPIIFTKTAAIIAAIVVAFPIMYQSAKVAFSQVDKNLEESARLDGASELQVFFKITLPLSLPTLITGAVLSIARAFGEFGVTIMIAGNIPDKTQTMSTAIYTAMSINNLRVVWIYVIIMSMVSVLFIILIQKINKRID